MKWAAAGDDEFLISGGMQTGWGFVYLGVDLKSDSSVVPSIWAVSFTSESLGFYLILTW